MVSIVTNTAAMQVLRSLSEATDLAVAARQRISTGLKVSGAKDDGAVFAMAQGVRAELSGWRAVSDNLARSQSILDVTTTSAATISDLLTELKGRVAALAGAPDSQSIAAINADIAALAAQVDRAARAASYDGVNLLNPGQVTTQIPVGGGPSPSVAFNVPIGRNANLISVNYTLTGVSSAELTLFGGSVQTQHCDGTYGYGVNVYNGVIYPAGHIYAPAPFEITTTADVPPPLPPYGVAVNSVQVTSYDTTEPVMISPDGAAIDLVKYPLTADAMHLQNLSNEGASVELRLSDIDDAIAYASSVAAHYGAQQNLIEGLQRQASHLQDTLETGLGNLVDADLAKESAKLQAAQVREKLAAESLAIASADPRWMLTLFRSD